MGQLFTPIMSASGMRHLLVPPALAGVVGVLLLGGTVAWKLLGSTYTRDVATLCTAQSASGLSVASDTARVTTWIQGHLTTPEGGRLFASLRSRPLLERGLMLERQARAVGRATCPMVQAYEEVSRRWDAKREMQDLCSTATFPDLATLDEPARLQVLEEWIDAHASTPLARSLAARLRDATTGADRAFALRDAAADAGVLTCDVAKVIAVPVRLSCGK